MKVVINVGVIIWLIFFVYGLFFDFFIVGFYFLCWYFIKYFEDVEKVIFFIWVCFDLIIYFFSCLFEGVCVSWEECNVIFGGVKFIDVFGFVWMDQNIFVEVMVGVFKQFKDEGKIGFVGLFEVWVEMICKVVVVVFIIYVEVEFLFWSSEIFINGVVKVVKECGVVLLSYVFFGYGFLMGQIKKVEDIFQGDNRYMFGRFQFEVRDYEFFLWCYYY